jgi:hypothetical protein
MRPDMVVMLNLLPRADLVFFKTAEDLPIQKVISEVAFKAFTKAILPRTARFNVSGFDTNTG